MVNFYNSITFNPSTEMLGYLVLKCIILKWESEENRLVQEILNNLLLKYKKTTESIFYGISNKQYFVLWEINKIKDWHSNEEIYFTKYIIKLTY